MPCSGAACSRILIRRGPSAFSCGTVPWHPHARIGKLAKGIRYCKKRWGALYCKMNMAGSGFPKAAGVTKERNVIIDLQKLWRCPHLHAAAELLSLGIDSFDKFGAFCSKLKVAAKNNPGALGPIAASSFWIRQLRRDLPPAPVSLHGQLRLVLVQWMDCSCCTPNRSERLFKRAWLSMRSGTDSNAKVCCATATIRAPSGQRCVS